MCVFLAAHFLSFSKVFVPTPGRLSKRLSIIERSGLTLGFVVNRPAHCRGRVHVLQLNFGTERLALGLAKGNVHVAAHLPFLHVGIGNPARDENLLKRLEISEGFLG